MANECMAAVSYDQLQNARKLKDAKEWGGALARVTPGPLQHLGLTNDPPTDKQQFSEIYGKGVLSAQTLGVSLFEEGTVLRLDRGAWSMIK